MVLRFGGIRHRTDDRLRSVWASRIGRPRGSATSNPFQQRNTARSGGRDAGLAAQPAFCVRCFRLAFCDTGCFAETAGSPACGSAADGSAGARGTGGAACRGTIPSRSSRPSLCPASAPCRHLVPRANSLKDRCERHPLQLVGASSKVEACCVLACIASRASGD
jgi:hypothetical protein